MEAASSASSSCLQRLPVPCSVAPTLTPFVFFPGAEEQAATTRSRSWWQLAHLRPCASAEMPGRWRERGAVPPFPPLCIGR